MIIAIDGPAGAGKSTVARAVAERLGLTYLDTGAMYRALAWLARERGIDLADGAAIGALGRAEPVALEPDDGTLRVSIAGRDVTAAIREQEIDAAASEIAAHPEVRATLVAAQRALLAQGGWVADGRDVGTVVCPEAPVKVFLTASPGERARRRRVELEARGIAASQEQVLAEVEQRDLADSGRPVGPLRAADDAVVIDSSRVGAQEVVERIVALARSRA